MRQRAVVIQTDGKIAEIEVSRSSMCEGCEKNGGCSHHCEISGIVSGSGKMRTTAQNKIGAKSGDTVEVETESARVLSYAALVFIMPIIVCAAFYFIGNAIWKSPIPSYIMAAIGFIFSFVGIAAFDRFKKKGTPDIQIVQVLTHSTGEPMDMQNPI